MHQYPKINMIGEKAHDLLFKSAKYKHSNWSYENEIRVINFDGNGLRKFKIQALRKIIFGSGCTESDRKTIMSLIMKFGYDHIAFYEATLNQEVFKVDIIPIEVERINEHENLLSKELEKLINSEAERILLQQTEENFYQKVKDIYFPRYEELLKDVINFLIVLDDKSREDFMKDRLPENGAIIRDILAMYEKESE